MTVMLRFCAIYCPIRRIGTVLKDGWNVRWKTMGRGQRGSSEQRMEGKKCQTHACPFLAQQEKISDCLSRPPRAWP